MAQTRKFLRRCRIIVQSPQQLRLCATTTQTAPNPTLSPARNFVELPGPLALSMLKHSAHVLPRIGNFHHSVGLGLLERLQTRYGKLVRLAKGNRSRPVLYVFDPGLMQQVYESGATSPPLWENSPLAIQRQQIGSTCPLHGENGDRGMTTLRKLLQDPSMLKNFDQAFEDIAADATRRLGQLRNTENALNEEFETEIYRWALEALGVVVFGIRLGCLDGTPFVQTTKNRSQKTSIEDDTPDLCSLSKRSLEECTPSERLVKIALHISRCGFLIRSEETLIKQSKTYKEALTTFENHLSLVEHFLGVALRDGDQNGRPEKRFLRQLRSHTNHLLPLIADTLLAGVDPLAHTAIAMLYHISLHAAAQQRVQGELSWLAESKIGKDHNSTENTTIDHTTTHNRDINIDVTSKAQNDEYPADMVKHPMDLPYIAACVKETLRLHPATGGVVRRSRIAFCLDGYEIPPGVDVVLAHGVTSKSEAEWGRAPTFIPDRWCPEGWEPLRVSRAHPAASKPFGETCPSSVVVTKILGSLLARVLESYRLEWHGLAPNMATSGVNRLQPPYYFVLQDTS